jgi:hypothetical protein
VVVIEWCLDLQLPMQSEPISTNVVSSNPAHDGMYSIQHYVIQFVSDLQQVGGFLRILSFPLPIKRCNLNIVKVALNTINSGRHRSKNNN